MASAFCRVDNQVLLLLRSNERNELVYSLPGGGAVAAGAGNLDTATREAKEHLGHLPDFQVLTTIVARYARSYFSLPSKDTPTFSAGQLSALRSSV